MCLSFQSSCSRCHTSISQTIGTHDEIVRLTWPNLWLGPQMPRRRGSVTAKLCSPDAIQIITPSHWPFVVKLFLFVAYQHHFLGNATNLWPSDSEQGWPAHRVWASQWLNIVGCLFGSPASCRSSGAPRYGHSFFTTVILVVHHTQSPFFCFLWTSFLVDLIST